MSTTVRNGRQGEPAPADAEKPSEPELMNRVLAATQAQRYSLEEVRYMAKAAGASGMFGMNESQAFVLMMIAESKGLHPIEAVQRYHIIHNRPAMKAEAMLAELLSHGWEVEWMTDEDDGNEQAAIFKHPRRLPEGKRVGFTMERARAADLKTDTWRKFPANMLRARTISNACRMLDPGIVIGLYTPEEISDFSEPRHAAMPVNLPAPVPATRPEPRVLTPPSREHSEPVLPASDIRRWIDDEVTKRNDLWRNACLIDKVDYKPLANAFQVANHLISAWITDGVLDEQDIQTDGKRDKFKVAQALVAAWEDSPGEVRDEVHAYLKSKLAERAAEAGVELGEDEASDEWPRDRE